MKTQKSHDLLSAYTEVSVSAPDPVTRYQRPESSQDSDGHATDSKSQGGIFERNFLLILPVAMFFVLAVFAAVICFSD
jgi:hypothetical protein